MKNLAFQNLCRLKNDYTINSHYRTYTFLFKGWENVLSELRSERLSYSWRCGVPIVMWCKTSRICSAELTGHFLRQHHRVRLLRDVFLTFQAAVVLENVVDGEWHDWLMMTGDVIFWEIKSVHIISFVLPLYIDKPAIRVESENVIFGLAILSASVWFQFVFIVIFVLGELTFSRCNMRHSWLSLSGWFSLNLVRCHFERKTVFGRLIVSIRSSFEKVDVYDAWRYAVTLITVLNIVPSGKLLDVSHPQMRIPQRFAFFFSWQTRRRKSTWSNFD